MFQTISNIDLPSNDYLVRNANETPYCTDKTNNPYIHFYKPRNICIFKRSDKNFELIFELHDTNFFFDIQNNNMVYFFQWDHLYVHHVVTNETKVICDMPFKIIPRDLYAIYDKDSFYVRNLVHHNKSYNILSYGNCHIFLDETKQEMLHITRGRFIEINNYAYILDKINNMTIYYDIFYDRQIQLQNCQNIKPISPHQIIVEEIYPKAYKLLTLQVENTIVHCNICGRLCENCECIVF